MFEPLKLAWAWLAAQNAVLPYLAVTLVVYALIYIWRKVSPRSWLWIEARLPWFEEFTKGEELAQNIAMALPSLLLGAVVTAVTTYTGSSEKGAFAAYVLTTVLGAFAGAFAPLLHHVRKALPFDPYRGALGKVKPPVLPVLYLFGLAVMASVQPSIVGCSPAARQAASANMVEKATALAFNGAVVALLLLDDQEARYLDALERPTELQLAEAQLRVNSLTRARDALAIVRRALSGELGDLDERGKLREAVKALDLVAAELEERGVKLPSDLMQALATARAVL